MKFWQQFETIDLHVCTKFWGNWLRDFGFRSQKSPRKFGVKSCLIQKRLSTAKSISHGYMSYATFVSYATFSSQLTHFVLIVLRASGLKATSSEA